MSDKQWSHQPFPLPRVDVWNQHPLEKLQHSILKRLRWKQPGGARGVPLRGLCLHIEPPQQGRVWTSARPPASGTTPVRGASSSKASPDSGPRRGRSHSRSGGRVCHRAQNWRGMVAES